MTDIEHLAVVARLSAKINGLKIRATYLSYYEGPVVSTYYFKLNWDQPIAKILKAEEDFAIACGVEAVVITRQGDKIAIEVPNRERKLIEFTDCLFNMMTSQEARGMALPLLLGVDTYGNNKYLDLATQPHVLIAGSTGGGKSVLLSSIIGGLAIAKTPQQLKLSLVDTKRLDLVLFDRLPHTFKMVEDPLQFQHLMKNLMGLIRMRGEQMRGIARNITEWNNMGMSPYMPHHVVVIDELADLIDQDLGRRMVDPEYDETWSKVPVLIKAMTQIARASGVHIIAATQRASVKVISGDIKTNLPTRICLRVPSRVDSQTILSTTGAENLLGKGDMLVESVETSSPKRYHGAFVSNTDIAKVLENASEIREQLLQLPVRV